MDLNTSANKFITKFKIKDNIYYIKVVWRQDDDDLFQVKVFDGGENSWSGKFSNVLADKFRKHLRKNLEEYCFEVKKCLKEQNIDYIYEFAKVQDEIDSATFKCSKPFEDVLVPYVSVPLQRDDVTESKDTLIDFLIVENKDLKHAVEVHNQQIEELICDLEKCKVEMAKFVNLKTSLEENLYGRFVQLLNEKKRRINLLEESLQKVNT